MSDTKKGLFTRPTAPAAAAIGPDVEQFVRGVETPTETLRVDEKRAAKQVEPVKELPKEEPLKRLTIDIPLGLHKRVKAGCAAQETTIAEVVREYLERKFPLPKDT